MVRGSGWAQSLYDFALALRCSRNFRRMPPCTAALAAPAERSHLLLLWQIGPVKVGSEHPIALQTMTTTDTRDVEATVEQVGFFDRT